MPSYTAGGKVYGDEGEGGEGQQPYHRRLRRQRCQGGKGGRGGGVSHNTSVLLSCCCIASSNMKTMLPSPCATKSYALLHAPPTPSCLSINASLFSCRKNHGFFFFSVVLAQHRKGKHWWLNGLILIKPSCFWFLFHLLSFYLAISPMYNWKIDGRCGLTFHLIWSW